MQVDKHTLILTSVIGILLVLIAVLVFMMIPQEEGERTNISLTLQELEVPVGPDLQNPTITDATSYLYLFTHTEDPFNYELSEDRYWRVGAMIEAVAQEYPSSDPRWVIEFMGSDLETIAARNEETGLLDYLLELKEKELVEFGYHAHHEPTYTNRPQNELSSTPSFDDAYDALWSWITCKKDVLYGGCIEERGGGLETVYDLLGEVTVVSGLGIGDGVQYERSAGSQAVRDLLPGRLLGFGFSDHGPNANNTNFADTRAEFLSILTPTTETSSATFWMDNAIRINDDAFLEDIGTSPLKEGIRSVAQTLDSLDGSQSFVINQGIASKYLYTASGTSPTKWGYANPDAPELPEDLLVSTTEREQLYANTEEAFSFIAEFISEYPDRLQFVGSNDVVNLFVSEDSQLVSEKELYNIALWVLNNWNGAPPSWTYDGEDFYSLADTFALLARGLNGEFEQAGLVSEIHGPWSLVDPRSAAEEVSTESLLALTEEELYNNGRMYESYDVGSVSLTSTQVLYGWSYLFVADQLDEEMNSFTIPATDSVPETYDLLETLGCTDCLDTTWSLKPARFQD